MPVQFLHNERDKYLEVRLSGKLQKGDYTEFGPHFEELLKQHGKLRMLVLLDDFHGWTFGGLWEDIKFDVKHFRDIERLAIVGEKKWHAGMATFCKPFTTAAVRYFEKFELNDAREWLTKEAPVAEAERAAAQSSRA